MKCLFFLPIELSTLTNIPKSGNNEKTATLLVRID